MTTSDIRTGVDFLGQFFSGTKAEVELRAFPSKHRIFTRKPNEIAAFLTANWNEDLYFGVATRKGGGDKSHCRELAAFFADVDDADENVLKKIESFTPEPSLINFSGGGYHAYWLLKEPMNAHDSRIEPILKGISSALDGDSSCAEIARILRVPGTFNHKPEYSEPVAVFTVRESWNRRYELADFAAFAQAPASINGNKRAAAPPISDELPVGQRRPALLSIAGSMRRRGAGTEEILAALVTMNGRRCKPPLDELELKAIAEDVPSRYQPHSEAGQKNADRDLQLGSISTAELFAAQESKIDWLAWPIAAIGLGSILDAPPKLGKTRLILEAIHASHTARTFLNFATKPMRVIYVSEQSQASLAMQAREVGFTGSEPIEKLRWITREFWSRFVFAEFLEKLEKQFLVGQNYNALIFDTWHTVARLEDENAASEVNRFGNLTIDLATRNHLALALARHDRKSGGEIGMSGRSSIQLSGLVDVILHLVRIPGQSNQRKLELLGRVPGLPNHQVIELVDGIYINRGEPEDSPAAIADRVALVRDWLDAEPKLSAADIVNRFAAMATPVAISVATAKRYRAEARSKK
jgi:hypothetical protein